MTGTWQLAIIQAFTAHWEMQIEQILCILSLKDKCILQNTFMTGTWQLAIIQAFTAPWEMQIEQMVTFSKYCLNITNF